jgi:hypothetical protein
VRNSPIGLKESAATVSWRKDVLEAVWRKTITGVRAFGNHFGSVRRHIIEDFFLRLAFLQKRQTSHERRKEMIILPLGYGVGATYGSFPLDVKGGN